MVFNTALEIGKMLHVSSCVTNDVTARRCTPRARGLSHVPVLEPAARAHTRRARHTHVSPLARRTTGEEIRLATDIMVEQSREDIMTTANTVSSSECVEQLLLPVTPGPSTSAAPILRKAVAVILVETSCLKLRCAHPRCTVRLRLSRPAPSPTRAGMSSGARGGGSRRVCERVVARARAARRRSGGA